MNFSISHWFRRLLERLVLPEKLGSPNPKSLKPSPREPKDAPTGFDQILDRERHYFIHLNRLYQLQMKVLEACEGRAIKNDLIYQQMLFASFDGLFTRLDNFHVRLVDLLNTLKNDHLDRFKRNNKKGLEVDPSSLNCVNGPDPGSKSAALEISRKFYAYFDGVYDRVFPGVKARCHGRPNHADFDRLADRLREVFAPIRTHRDTVVAHWDAKQVPATVSELKDAFDHVEQLLKDLFYISRLILYEFELGGNAARVDKTARDMAELILGRYRTRRAKADEMDSVYLAGFDVWGGAQSKDQYLAGCRGSAKYARGTWYVLEDADGKPVSALITYELPGSVGQPVVGIGSIATDPNQRKKGHAAQLLCDVMRLHHPQDGKQVFYLHSDIDPHHYERLGFVRLPSRHQKKQGSVTMVCCPGEVREEILSGPGFHPPVYF